MIEGKAQLVVDLGNSSTRILTIFGKTPKTGRPRQRISTIPNKFGELTSTRLLDNEDYNESNSSVFVIGEDTMFCTGLLCDIEKGSASMRPSSSDKKYNNVLSLYSMRMAFLEGYKHISDMTGSPKDAIDVSWEVTVLLPPSDIELGAKVFADNIRSITELNFVMPEFKKSLTIDKVRVLQEGFCAFVGLVFDKGRVLREGMKELATQSTLIVDIGAGTTDLCVIKNMKLVDSSRFSESTGGNKVYQKLDSVLRKKFGKGFTDDEVRNAAINGTIKMGAREFDVTDDIITAKSDVAATLSSAIRNALEGADFSLMSIENVLICGGGAIDGGEKMKSLGDFLKEQLMKWMEYSNFLEMPDYTDVVESDGEEVEVTKTLSPRLLNILGAGVLSEPK